MCLFTASGENLVLWVLVVQGKEGKKARSRGKARRGEGIRRKEKMAGVRIV